MGWSHRVAQAIAQHMKVPEVKSEMILEGGSVHTDGEGWGSWASRVYLPRCLECGPAH